LLRFIEEQARDETFRATKHPVMQSIEPGENWMWCFVDELALD
jgi:hypothetical protein